MNLTIFTHWLIPALLLALIGCQSPAPPCGSPVTVTWLGVTTYALEYNYQGKTVRILLDHQINGAYYDEALANLEFDSVDYLFIGHNHFDHTGHCAEQADVLCEVTLAAYGEPELPWVGAPFIGDAHERYGAHIVAPYALCEDLDEKSCTGLWAMDGVQRFTLEDIGLTVTAFPNAHSQEFGDLDFAREHPEDNEPDPFTFIFEFPAEDKSCHSSFLWANTTLTKEPYLNYTETLTRDEQTWSFDYQALLREAMETRNNKPITYWTFWGDTLPKQAWQQWADIVLPEAWSNHHHGVESSAYFPDLHRAFPGHALGGTRDAPNGTWVDTSESADTLFLPLDNYWATVTLENGKAVQDKGKQEELLESFRERLQAILNP